MIGKIAATDNISAEVVEILTFTSMPLATNFWSVSASVIIKKQN